ncbi:MAG: YidC/Oxa1 family membrane protein insertase [Clostridia bacterium]
MGAIASLFGYLLNWLYSFLQNYGLAIILFSIILKIILLPISIKQQKTMKKSAKIQAKMKEIQSKYKNDPERLNQETISLYRTEKMSPFSGCLSSIAQLVLLFAVFYLVKSPLTYMKKVDPEVIKNYQNEIIQEYPDKQKSAYPEIEVIQYKGPQDERVNLNMDFFGIDLSKVPTQSLNDPRVYIIPVLYVISSFVMMRITTAMQNGEKDKKEKEQKKEEPNELDAMAQANKSMSLIMPIMSVSIAIIAPLGLALYWLVSNILMIIERLILNKISDDKEEKENA